MVTIGDNKDYIMVLFYSYYDVIIAFELACASEVLLVT